MSFARKSFSTATPGYNSYVRCGETLILSRSQKIIRAILSINFLFALFFVVPVAHHFIDSILRGLESVGWGVAGVLMPLWVVASTLVATVLLIWETVRHRKRGRSVSPLAVDGTLLVAWWVTLLGFMAYGYALGLGG